MSVKQEKLEKQEKYVIDKLTDEDYKKMDALTVEFMKYGLDTRRAVRAKAEAAVKKIYTQAGLKEPKAFIWLKGPEHGTLANVYYEDLKMPVDEIVAAVEKATPADFDKHTEAMRKYLSHICYGSHDVAWLAFYKFFHDRGAPNLEKVEPFIELAKEACWWWPHEELAIMTEKPLCYHLDNNDQLHCEDGPAIEFADGLKIYSWHGLDIPDWFIEEKEKITFKTIKEQTNAELKRVLVDIYGRDNYLKDIGAKKVDYDEKYGILWQGKEAGESEPICYVEVTNSTYEGSFAPEYTKRMESIMTLPDGKEKTDLMKQLEADAAKEIDAKTLFRRKFFIRVPPTVKTAHEAVAWTFYQTPKTYDLDAEA